MTPPPASPSRSTARPSPATRTACGCSSRCSACRSRRSRSTCAPANSARPEFLRRNAFGQVPVIEDGEVTLADSNAILVYLDGATQPTRRAGCRAIRVGAARVQRWLSVAAGQLAQGPAMARVIVLFGLDARSVRRDRARARPAAA